MPSDAGFSADDQLQALSGLLGHAHSVAPAQLLTVIREAARSLGAHADMLLADFAQTHLTALEEHPPDVAPHRVAIEGSLAGRVFTHGAPVTTPLADGGILVTAPMLNGIERLGVLELAFPVGSAETALPQARRFTELVTQLVATKGRVTDEFHRLRCRQPMTLAAQMQWQMLPPMTAHAPEVTIAGQVEPAYTVGGDAFDYALNWGHAHLAIFDAMGHGVAASVVTALAVGAYRHSRRRDEGLAGVMRAMDAAVRDQFHDERFVTALLADLDLATGRITMLNAGHLQPVLLRGRQVVAVPEVPPGLPLGLGGLLPPAAERIVEHQLQPGDRLLFVTDGILDAVNAAGEPFGEQRLAELTERAAHDQLPLVELARAITQGVVRYQQGQLRDDASLLMLEYSGTANDGDSLPPSTAPRPVT